MQFTMKGLDKLVATLEEDDFKLTKAYFNNIEQFQLVKQKGVFPYDFFDSMEKLNHSSLPSREIFFDTLNDKECSEKVRIFYFCLFIYHLM